MPSKRVWPVPGRCASDTGTVRTASGDVRLPQDQLTNTPESCSLTVWARAASLDLAATALYTALLIGVIRYERCVRVAKTRATGGGKVSLLLIRQVIAKSRPPVPARPLSGRGTGGYKIGEC